MIKFLTLKEFAEDLCTQPDWRVNEFGKEILEMLDDQMHRASGYDEGYDDGYEEGLREGKAEAA